MQKRYEKKLPFPLSLMLLTEAEILSCFEIQNKTTGIIARLLNKRFSLPVSIYLARWGIVPNWITFFNLLLGIFAGVLASLGTSAALLEAGVLFQLVSIIDGCDGEVAKINHKSSRWGAWFDTFGDNFSLIAFVAGVAWGYYQQTQAIWVWQLSIFDAVVMGIMFFIMFRYLLKQKNSHPSLVNYDKEVVSQSPLSSGLKVFITYSKYLVKKDFFALLFCVLAAFNHPIAILSTFSIGIFSITVILLVIQLRADESAQTDSEAIS